MTNSHEQQTFDTSHDYHRQHGLLLQAIAWFRAQHNASDDSAPVVKEYTADTSGAHVAVLSAAPYEIAVQITATTGARTQYYLSPKQTDYDVLVSQMQAGDTDWVVHGVPPTPENANTLLSITDYIQQAGADTRDT